MAATRLVVPTDIEFLWEMVYWAAHVDDDVGVHPDDIRSDPDLAGHVQGWGREGDLGVIAERHGVRVGAAWLRLFDPATSDYSAFFDDHTPELVVAVAPQHLDTGVGSVLLTALFEHADHRFETIVLTVRSGNPAQRLYERFGFREVERVVNRVGTESAKMVRRSPAAG